MNSIRELSNQVLLERMAVLVRGERLASAEVIEHLMEIDRRRLYLVEACSSLSAYCRERLGYSEDEAVKRVRVARLARRCPEALGELRAGSIHLTGLFLLSQHVNEGNRAALFAEARGKSRREIEAVLARHFPTRAVPGRVRPISESEVRVEFTACREFSEKLERARELVSHALPSGDLAMVLERGLDALIAHELRRRDGAGLPRKRRSLKPGSRHVPVEVARAVWERDGGQCTFLDERARRCSARRFVTLEHREPFALGGAATVENLCLLCKAHNEYRARQVFGAGYVERQRERRELERARGPLTVRDCAVAVFEWQRAS